MRILTSAQRIYGAAIYFHFGAARGKWAFAPRFLASLYIEV